MLVVLAAATFAFAFAGCSSVESAVEKATGCKVDVDDEQASTECKDGKGSVSLGDSAKIPKGFPTADVPLPDGNLISAISTKISGDQGYNLSYTFDGSISNAAKDYKQTLRAAGFTVDDSDSFSAGDGAITGFTAARDDWKVTVVGGGGSSDDDSGAVSVTVVSSGESGSSS